MAQDSIFSIALKIVGHLAMPAFSELGYIISYGSNVDSFNTQLQTLEVARTALQQRVNAAKDNDEVILVNVQNWLMNVDGTIADAKNFQNKEERASVGCFGGPFTYLCIRHQLSKKATEMVTRISEVLTQGNFNEISYLPRLPMAITPLARGYEALHSRTLILGEILQALKDSNIYKIGVWGMGGVGKSTLVKEIAWQIEQEGSFGTVVMANVTNSPDVEKIQGEIADRLGLKFKEKTEVGRAIRLRERIKKENSILIMLDDIWEKLDLTEVGVPFYEEHKGCKLLFTSRDLNVLSCEMGTQKDFRLEVLSKEESWSLFEKMAGDVVKDINLQPIALEVAESCVGLPLLIATVAKALQNKDLYGWKDALNQLTRFDHKGLPAKVYSAIELSYNHLANDELKSLFLLIGSLGQNTVWSRYLLISFWSLGLYEHTDTLASARNRLYNLVIDLKSSCLLLEGGGEEDVKMHDVVHEVASKIASRDRPIFVLKRDSELKQWPQMEWLKKCYRIFLPRCCIHELPKILQCPELEILELSSRGNYLKVPDEFFAWIKDQLRCLYLEGVNCTKSLPSSLIQLTNLRALSLRQCMLQDISLVGDIRNLEILDLRGSDIRELPDVIRQLASLRLLDLSNCSGLRAIPAKLISSLTCLEELYILNTYIKWEVEGSKRQGNNATLGELRHLHQLTTLEILIQDALTLPKDLPIFGKLERYKIYIGEGWKWTWTEQTRVLKLNQSTIPSTHLDRGVKFLLDNVENLYLSQLKGVNNVLYQLNGEGFPQLKHLNIHSSMEIQYIIDSKEWHHSYQVFPSLESLVLHNLTNMKRICNGPLPLQSFTKLKVIKVKGCDLLENLLSYSMARDLSALLEVEITQCKTMSEFIANGDIEIDKIEFPRLHSVTLASLPMLANFVSKPLTNDMKSKSVTEIQIPMALFDEKISFPNLESLKISSINIRKIWADRISADCYFQNLRSLTIEGCSSIKYLFSSSVARGLLSLQHLNITRCGMLEEIFIIEGKMDSSISEEFTFPSLETLVVSHIDNLKSVYHDELASNPFPKLIKMEISFCQKLLTVFPSYVLNNLYNLETLLVTNCSALEVVFETQGLNNGATSQGKLATQLRTLTLEALPVLKHIWSNDPRGSLQFPNLCIVKAIECQSLSYVFPLFVAMALLQLQELDIRNCGVESIVAIGEMVEVEEDLRLVFPQLTSLTFWNLVELKSFYPGIHTLHCPMIKKLDVYHCDELEIFKSISQNCQEVVSFHGQPLFSSAKVIPKIEELSLSSNDVKSICNGEYHDDDLYANKALSLQCFHDVSDEFPAGFLQRFTNLENLNVECSSFTEIFSSENVSTFIKLKALKLNGLLNLEYLYKEKSEIQPILQNLETLEVYSCSKLKNIVSFPSSVLFHNLDKLWIGNCSGLLNIMTSSTARSLLKLRILLIYNCEMVEEIVTSEDDGDESEIDFMKLEHLELQNLPRFTSFCKGNFSFKFPLLETLYVIECPNMETFSHGILSTPNLRKVQVKDYEIGESRWEGELNTTIRKIFDEKDSKKD